MEELKWDEEGVLKLINRTASREVAGIAIELADSDMTLEGAKETASHMIRLGNSIIYAIDQVAKEEINTNNESQSGK